MAIKVFCDIQGTFTGGIKRDIELKNFVEHLRNLSLGEKISFSFISSNTLKEIEEYIKELSEYIKETNIYFGTQFAGDYEIIEDGTINAINNRPKADQIIDDVMSHEYSEVYYFDDNNLNLKIVNMIFQRRFSHIKYKSFSPRRNSRAGIDILNQMLLEHNKNKKESKGKKL